MKLKENYGNFLKVRKAFRDFVFALASESVEYDDNENSLTLNDNVIIFCNIYDRECIAKANQKVSEFLKRLTPRYEVCMHTFGEDGKRTVKKLCVEDVKYALNTAAKFRMENANSQTFVYDHIEEKTLMELY